MTTRLALLFAFLLFGAPAFAAAPYKADPGPYRVETELGVWHDGKRDRDIPWKIYFAPEAPGPRPVVVFSHGLGGSREAAAYLGEHLASYGYVAVHIQHPGSDESVWRGLTEPADIMKALAAAARDLSAARARFEDVPFALDSLAAMNDAEGPLHGRLDLTRLGMSGHSYGAVSTLVAAGQRLGPRGGFQFKEPRFKAAIAYSPNKPIRGDDYARAYGDIQIPMLHFTGTEDMNPLDPAEPPSDRQIPFQNIPDAGQYLVVLNGGDHRIFGGRERMDGPRPTDARFLSLISQASIAFWDAYLLGDPAARIWLRDGGAAAELGSDATFAMRN